MTHLDIGGSQTVVLRPAAAATCGDLLEMQTLGPHSRNLGIEAPYSVFEQTL